MLQPRIPLSRFFRQNASRQRFFHSTRRRLDNPSKPSPPPPSPNASAATSSARISRLETRLPKFLRHIITPLRNAPLSHITAFLILHEITAIVPLFALAATFHYTQWLPPFISEWKWMKEGVERFGKWMRKRGWLGAEEEGRALWWGRGEGSVGVLVELATAYAVTKALLPVRLVVSVWATPWFARWTVLPVTTRLRNVFRRAK